MGKNTNNIQCEKTVVCVTVKCEVLLMGSGFTNLGKGDRNEPKSERPITSKMSEYVAPEMQMIMHQVMLQWAHQVMLQWAHQVMLQWAHLSTCCQWAHQVMLQWAHLSTCCQCSLPLPTRSSLQQQNNNVQREACFNPLNPSGYYIYHRIKHYINSTFCPHSVFVWI